MDVQELCISIHQARLWNKLRPTLRIALAHLTIHSIELPSLATRNILTQPVSANLLPLHLLAGNGQLSPQPLECTLGHAHERAVQFLLVVALRGSNAGDDGLGGDGIDGDLDGLGGVQSDVAVFVVVYIDVDLARHGCGRGGDGNLVDGTESAVPKKQMEALAHVLGVSFKVKIDSPEVVRRVSVRDQKDCDGRVVLDGIDTIRAVRVMLLSMNA